VQTFTYSLKPALASGKLVEILAWRPAPYPFHVVYARHRHVPPRLRVFIDWLAAVFPLRCRDKARYLTQRRGWSTIERTDRYFSFYDRPKNTND
jgi:hypothetical protein